MLFWSYILSGSHKRVYLKFSERFDISLKSLPKKNITTDGKTDIVINGLGFIKITTKSNLVVYTLDEDIISTRNKMI